MKLKNLHDALVHELQDLYSAEKQLLQALPQMAKAANNEDLSTGFEEHLEQTRGHVERLETAFEELGVSAGRAKCKAMEGLIAEAKQDLSEEASPEVLDALIISIAQKIEHYEIAGYGTARAFAERLGEEEVADILQETLDEEIETDAKLTEIASTAVNDEAEEGDEEPAED